MADATNISYRIEQQRCNVVPKSTCALFVYLNETALVNTSSFLHTIPLGYKISDYLKFIFYPHMPFQNYVNFYDR